MQKKRQSRTRVNVQDVADKAGVSVATVSRAFNLPDVVSDDVRERVLATAKRNGVDWRSITGTSNQSDYLSHYVANHMFFRLALPGAKRVLVLGARRQLRLEVLELLVRQGDGRTKAHHLGFRVGGLQLHLRRAHLACVDDEGVADRHSGAGADALKRDRG